MRGPELYVARMEPYRLSDLDRLLESIRSHPLVRITTIGKTAEGRDLEIVRIGNPAAPYRVFVRARAHPWEAGSNWVAEGLIQRLLKDDAEAKRFLRLYSVNVLPMANKDGVARGRTRFNLRGKDLNRNWDKPADPELAPENAALERWLEGEIAAGRRPHLALELHNDGNGRLHVSRPPVPQLERHLARMAIFEELLRSKTWFTEGSHQRRVPQQRHARRRLARALRHRRGRPRVQLQLDRRPEGLHVEPALEGLRRQPRGGVSRLLRSGEAVSELVWATAAV